MLMRVFSSFFALLCFAGTLVAQQVSYERSGDWQISQSRSSLGLSPVTQTQGDEFFGYAYRTPSQTNAIGIGEEGHIAAAIKLPRVTGNVIKKIRFECDQKDDTGRIFIFSSSSLKCEVVQEVKIVAGTNEFAFASPYTIKEGEDCYVGYQINAKAQPHPIRIDSESEAVLPNVNYIVATNPKGYFTLGQSLTLEGNFLDLTSYKFGNLSIFALVEGDNPMLQSVVLPLKAEEPQEEQAPGAEVDLALSLRNLGTKPLSSIVLGVKYGQQPEKSIEITGLNVKVSEDTQLKLKVKVAQRGIGRHRVRVIKSNEQPDWIGGTAYAKFRVTTPEGEAPRREILIERFTGEGCPQCPRLDDPLKTLISGLKEAGIHVNFITHHAGHRPDFLTLAESSDLVPYAFNATGSFAPALMVDRLASLDLSRDNGAELAALDQMFDQNNPTYQRAIAIPQPMQFTSFAKQEQGDKVSFVVKGKTGYVDEADIYLSAVITENDLPARNQAGAGKDYKHHDVARRYLTPSMGLPITLAPDGSFEVTTEAVRISPAWKTEKLKIIIFAHKDIRDPDRFYRGVYASKSYDWRGKDTAVADVPAEEPRIYVVDGYLGFEGTVDALEVYDMAGRLVTRSADRRLVPGVYVVKAIHVHGVATSKIVVE